MERDIRLGERFVHIDLYEVMQYTGIKDKNGREIYEGDIVCIGELEQFQRYEIVEWVKITSGCCDMETNYGWSNDAVEQCEVLGNIYENPGMLEHLEAEQKKADKERWAALREPIK